jgi:hypothetical protein
MDPNYALPFSPFEPHAKRLHTPSEYEIMGSNKRFRTSHGHKNLYMNVSAKSGTRDSLINQAGSSSVTIPIPFSFKTDERARSTSKAPMEPPRRIFKAKPLPKSCKTPSFTLKPSGRVATKPVEFNLSSSNSENRSSDLHKPASFTQSSFTERSALKALDIQNYERKGTWNGWPKSGPSYTESKPQCSFTVVEPFNLRTEERAKPTSQPQANPFVFKSKPMPDFSHPFKPKASSTEPSKPAEFALHSDQRAYERLEFDLQQQQKRAEQEAMEARLLQEQADLEAAQLQTYRLSLEFKARPVPSQAPFELKYPPVVLTIPESPNLRTSRRADMRDAESIEQPVFMDID